MIAIDYLHALHASGEERRRLDLATTRQAAQRAALATPQQTPRIRRHHRFFFAGPGVI